MSHFPASRPVPRRRRAAIDGPHRRSEIRSSQTWSNLARIGVRADRVEDVPAKGRLGQQDRRERPTVGLHHLAKALRLAGNDQRQEARSRTTELPNEHHYLVMLEVVREDDRRLRRLGDDECDVLEGARAARRNTGAAQVRMKAVERLRVRRNDRYVDWGSRLPSVMGRDHDGPSKQARCRPEFPGPCDVISCREPAAPGTRHIVVAPGRSRSGTDAKAVRSAAAVACSMTVVRASNGATIGAGRTSAR